MRGTVGVSPDKGRESYCPNWAMIMFSYNLKQCFNGLKTEGICGKGLYQVRVRKGPGLCYLKTQSEADTEGCVQTAAWTYAQGGIMAIIIQTDVIQTPHFRESMVLKNKVS